MFTKTSNTIWRSTRVTSEAPGSIVLIFCAHLISAQDFEMSYLWFLVGFFRKKNGFEKALRDGKQDLFNLRNLV